jgi:ADP-heptose:LPS heptosyltransferase
VHLSLNASLPLKEWPLNNNLNLIRDLLAKSADRTLVVTAAPNPREQARLEQVRQQLKNARLLLINERLSVARLAALLQRCALHVGPDSGVIHLAAALNIPVVGIYRRYHDMADWLPQGLNHACFDAPCPCMGSKHPACAATGEAACLAGISAELVGQEICRRLAENPTPAPR